MGIGTDAPAEALDVTGNVLATSFLGDTAKITALDQFDVSNVTTGDAIRIQNTTGTAGLDQYG